MSIRGKMKAIMALVAVVAVVAVMLVGLGAATVGADEPPVVVKATVSTEGSISTVDISITNNMSGRITSFQVQGLMPQSGKLVAASPSQYVFSGSDIKWESGSGINPGKTFTGYQYKIDGAAGNISVNVKYTGSASGSASSGDVAIGTAPAAQAAQATPTPEPPRRGCLACHVLANKSTGAYTLGYEAAERAEADFGAEHPTVAPSGAKVDKMTVANVKACLECHKPSKDNPGRGVGAPITLRDIVHPAHMFSKAFVEHYNGTCFTCHNVKGDGTFELLTEKVDVNQKGVPKAMLNGAGSIPGAIPPSESGQ